MPSLILFYRPTCPYCQKVLAFIKSHEIAVEMKDISRDPSLRDELITQGGKSQVPCLLIDNKPLYESDDIIDWLKKNVVNR